jgi:phosphoribosyl-ATP pyrophosphohydrolase/phosphoribosyl-AMP cyclohydrolase
MGRVDSQVEFDENGLAPCVVQDARTGEVLTLAYMNEEALERTRATGEVHFWSRSRGELWHKGETSGNTMRLVGLRVDCDGDAVLYRAEQEGAACHTGARTCFSTVIEPAGKPVIVDSPAEETADDVLGRLAQTIASRAARRPDGSYTARLLAEGLARVSQKVGEEAVEVVVAAQSEDDERLASEAADLLYHLLVLLQARGVPLNAVWQELERREKKRER